MRSIYLCLILLSFACLSAFANPVPTDPQIVIDSGGDPLDLSTKINVVQPDGTDPLHFSFVNNLDGIVTSLTFNTMVNAGLTDPEWMSGFSCPQPLGYFLSCAVNYTSLTGALQYQFSGVNPSDGDENFPIDHDNEFDQFEGIPIGGDFTITLNGWIKGATAPSDGKALYANLPMFDNSFTATPEPSMVLLVAMLGILLVSIAGFVRRRENRKERSTE
jgi:hypothetical protein